MERLVPDYLDLQGGPVPIRIYFLISGRLLEDEILRVVREINRESPVTDVVVDVTPFDEPEDNLIFRCHSGSARFVHSYRIESINFKLQLQPVTQKRRRVAQAS